MSDDTKRETLEVLKKHFLCVLSTVDSESRPESAIVGFSAADSLELLIGTSVKTRKLANISQNPHVAVVVGDTESEIQYEGTARQLTQEELDEMIQSHFGKLPGRAEYLEDPDQTWLLITPTWLRLTVHENPNRVEEVSFA